MPAILQRHSLISSMRCQLRDVLRHSLPCVIQRQRLTRALPPPTQSLSPEEQRLFRLYGKLPSRSDHFAKHLKERKYFDSGDYALSKAGKADSVDTGAVGSQHPVPEDIPHLSSPVNGSNGGSIGGGAGLLGGQPRQGSIQAGSPVKESSFLHRETSADDAGEEAKQEGPVGAAAAQQLQSQNEGLPIRR
jgi:hypothetical protein